MTWSRRNQNYDKQRYSQKINKTIFFVPNISLVQVFSCIKYVFQLDASGEFMLGDLLLFHGWNPPKISVVKFLVRLLLGGSSFYSVNDLTIFLLLSSAPLAFIIISPHQRKLSWEKIENTWLKLSLTYCSINIIASLAHVISVQIPNRP